MVKFSRQRVCQMEHDCPVLSFTDVLRYVIQCARAWFWSCLSDLNCELTVMEFTTQ